MAYVCGDFRVPITRRGIFFIGTLNSSRDKLRMIREPDALMLLAAKRKYSQLLQGLEPVNFSWPSDLVDEAWGIHYETSPAVQQALQPHKGARLKVALIAPPARFDASCRMGSTISLPDFTPHEEYIRRALNLELKGAGLADTAPGSASGATELTGVVTELDFATYKSAYWVIGLSVSSPGGRSAQVKVKVDHAKEKALDAACGAAEGAFPAAVRAPLEALVKSPQFAAILAEAGSPVPVPPSASLPVSAQAPAEPIPAL